MVDYDSRYSGQQIDTLLGKVESPDSTPTTNSQGLITSGGVKSALDGKANASSLSDTNTRLSAVEGKIPAQASAQNQLADKEFVNSSISTATATYRGSYNLVTDLSLTTSATEQQIAAALAGAISTAYNNDYCLVQVPTADAKPTEIARVDRYKFNGTAWVFEFSLNNSGFTAAQWAAINSGITSGLVTAFSAKYDKPSDGIPKTDLASGVQDSLGAADTAYQKPASGIPASDIASGVIPDVSGKEDKLNKVTAISDSSTDTEYPSAKAVNDAIKAGSVSEALRLKTEVKANQSFVFRKSAKTIGTDSLTIDKIKGRTLAWNQIVPIPASDASAQNNGVTLTDNRDGSYTLNGTASDITFFNVLNNVPIPSVSHKYFAHVGAKTNGLMVNFTDLTTGGFDYVKDAAIGIGTWTVAHFTLQIQIYAGTVLNNEKIYPFLTDLTLKFGEGSEPSTVAEFEALYPLAYYAYNTGKLINNKAKAFENEGFNLWDEEWELGTYSQETGEASSNTDRIRSKNFISVFGGVAYYAKCPVQLVILSYDANKNFIGAESVKYITNGVFTTPTNAAFIKFYTGSNLTTYNHDICINLSDPAKNGQYEPYKRVVLPLNLSDLEVISPNIWDEEWENGSVDAQGQKVSEPSQIRSKNYIPVIPYKSYYLNVPNYSSWIGVSFYDANKNFISGGALTGNSFVVGADARYILFNLSDAYGATYNNDICINVSNPGWNGNYYPHGTFKPFPDGLKSAGNIYDEIRGNKVIRRVGTVDLGSLEYVPQSAPNGVYSAIISGKVISSYNANNVISEVYPFNPDVYRQSTDTAPDKALCNLDNTNAIYFKDLTFAGYTYAQVAAALSGVMLNYEQAVPEEFDPVTPLPLSTFSGTTERRLPEDTENDVMAPFECDMTYGTNNEQMLDAMNAKAVSVSKDTLLTLLNALKSGSVIADYSITRGDNGPELVITPNS